MNFQVTVSSEPVNYFLPSLSSFVEQTGHIVTREISHDV